MFLIFSLTGAGAVFHVHSQNAVMVTLLFPGREFRMTHQHMIKAIVNCQTGKNHRYELGAKL